MAQRDGGGGRLAEAKKVGWRKDIFCLPGREQLDVGTRGMQFTQDRVELRRREFFRLNGLRAPLGRTFSVYLSGRYDSAEEGWAMREWFDGGAVSDTRRTMQSPGGGISTPPMDSRGRADQSGRNALASDLSGAAGKELGL